MLTKKLPHICRIFLLGFLVMFFWLKFLYIFYFNVSWFASFYDFDASLLLGNFIGKLIKLFALLVRAIIVPKFM